MWSSLGFASGLLVFSCLMIGWHIRSWSAQRIKDGSAVDAQERRFQLRRLRCRLGASGLIGAAGLVLFASPWIVDPTTGLFWWYWIVLLALVVGIGVLAAADALNTREHLQRQCQVLESHIGPSIAAPHGPRTV